MIEDDILKPLKLFKKLIEITCFFFIKTKQHDTKFI